MAVKKKSSKRLKSALVRATSGCESDRDSERLDPPANPVAGGPAAPPELSPGLAAAEDVKAVAQSSVALVDGVQAFGRALIDMQRQAFAAGLLAASALVDARNLDDVMEIQRRYVTRSVESAVKESAGLAELAGRVASEAWAPLASRVGRAPNRFSRS